jgi:hypothetical protein
VSEVEGSPFSTRLLVYVAFFNYAPSSIIIELAGAITASVDGMTSEEWSVVVGLVEHKFDRISFPGRPEPGRTTSVPDVVSRRVAYLLALHSNRAVARGLFLKHFLHAGDREPFIAEFRQTWAVEAALAGELEWPEALNVVKKTYAQGAAYSLQSVLHGDVLPQFVSDEVLSNARLYPGFLWDAAERAASAKARKAIRAVGKVAKQDKWLSN